MRFGDKLNALLGERDMTPADLVRKTGIPKATVSRYLRDGQPSWPYAILIANALGVSLDTLAGRSVHQSQITTDIIETCSRLNCKGQRRVLDYSQDLVSSGRYSSAEGLEAYEGREHTELRAAGSAG